MLRSIYYGETFDALASRGINIVGLVRRVGCGAAKRCLAGKLRNGRLYASWSNLSVLGDNSRADDGIIPNGR